VDFNDFRQQILVVKQMGPISEVLSRTPRLKPLSFGLDSEKEFKQIEAIINSMTARERLFPEFMTVPRRCLRVADGAGVQPSDVTGLYTQFKMMRDALAQMRNAVAQMRRSG
jgi:signal recognition particle subunit SRP54